MKKIGFSLDNKELESFVVYPSPAIKSLPEWYKKMPPYDGGKFSLNNLIKTSTVKKCMPFFDSISSGYYLYLGCDIYVDSGPRFNWSINTPDWQPVYSHNDYQMSTYDFGDIYYPHIFKWINPFLIRTPKGYSVHASSPSNMVNLPFYTFSGIVDTDSFNLPINFPFLLKKDFAGIIEKGTPIAQINIFKRKKWKMYFYEEETSFRHRELFNQSKIKDHYKNYFWSRKKYT